jgi:hypothetical protein
MLGRHRLLPGKGGGESRSGCVGSGSRNVTRMNWPIKSASPRDVADLPTGTQSASER